MKGSVHHKTLPTEDLNPCHDSQEYLDSRQLNLFGQQLQPLAKWMLASWLSWHYTAFFSRVDQFDQFVVFQWVSPWDWLQRSFSYTTVLNSSFLGSKRPYLNRRERWFPAQRHLFFSFFRLHNSPQEGFTTATTNASATDIFKINKFCSENDFNKWGTWCTNWQLDFDFNITLAVWGKKKT